MALAYSEGTGWTGGADRTLYAITDRRTGVTIVRCDRSLWGIGPEVDITIATRAQAEALWQMPLHPGWTVVEPGRGC